MSPQPTYTQQRTMDHHPQRPWRPVEAAPRHPGRFVARSYAAAVVRELPPRSAQREPGGTW